MKTAVKQQTAPAQRPASCGIGMVLLETQSGKEFLKVSELCEGIKFCSKEVGVLSLKKEEETSRCFSGIAYFPSGFQINN